MSSLTPKVVSFEVTKTDAGAAHQNLIDDSRIADKYVLHMHQQAQRLAVSLDNAKGDFKYLRQRETGHRNTAESMNTRVLWWSIWEAVLIVILSCVQIYYLRRYSFPSPPRTFEVKRGI